MPVNKNGCMMKRIFVIDWMLILMFVLSAFSGIELHIAGLGSNHELWHNWAVFHVLASFLFLTTVILHITTHWGWYKGVMRNGIGRKSRITLMLSILFLFVSVTGIILIGIDGANSDVGLWHYRIGIITIVFSVGHILKRIPLLRKSIG